MPSGHTHCRSCSTNGTPFVEALLRNITRPSLASDRPRAAGGEKEAHQLFAPFLSHVLTLAPNALEHSVHVLVSAQEEHVRVVLSSQQEEEDERKGRTLDAVVAERAVRDARPLERVQVQLVLRLAQAARRNRDGDSADRADAALEAHGRERVVRRGG